MPASPPSVEIAPPAEPTSITVPAPAPVAAPVELRRTEPIATPRTELGSATVVPVAPVVPTTSGRDTLTRSTPEAVDASAADRATSGATHVTERTVAGTDSTPAVATTRAVMPAPRLALRSGVPVELTGAKATPSPRAGSDVLIPPPPPPQTGDGVFSARVEAPIVPIGAGGSSLLAVLASYIIPGSGPVPMSLAITLLAQVAVLLMMMRAPRQRLAERVVLIGLTAGMTGHRRAVQRPG